jgi:thiol-disulfide isomerase/thioredoxin
MEALSQSEHRTTHMLSSLGSDLSPILKNPSPVLAVFYADWCPFCLSFLPEFEGLASEQFQTAKVDLSDWENPLWEEYKIDVVPTLVAFDKGKEVARRDGRRGIGLSRKDIDEMKRKLEER